jgi:hypothetical protein
MRKEDVAVFADIWGASLETYGKTPSDAQTMMAFSLLEKYSLAEIKHALGAYMSDSDEGRFMPKPANIIGHIEALNPDGFLSSDEAWAIALDMMDENNTVVVTDQIMYAMPTATQIYNSGDAVGARMAFKQAYDRLLNEARAKGDSPRWYPTLGHDPARRKGPILAGIEQGLLGPGHLSEVRGLLTDGEMENAMALMDQARKMIPAEVGS